jgi:hypothetical protein
MVDFKISDDNVQVEFGEKTVTVGELKKNLYRITEDRMRLSLVTQHKEFLTKLRNAEIPYTAKQVKEAVGGSGLLIGKLKMYEVIAAFRPIEEARSIYYVITKRACDLLDSHSPTENRSQHGKRKETV